MLLLDAIPSVKGRPDWLRRKLQSVCAGRGYGRDVYHHQVRARTPAGNLNTMPSST
ncbi:hypothetical protein JYK04_08170 [Streptomyces nojiriensis]|nr:hypothetical protein JYK04_08170 [Streptomyces nojiriensis]